MQFAKRYGWAALIGLDIYVVLANVMIGQRGYFAFGGEILFLAMPLWLLLADLVRWGR